MNKVFIGTPCYGNMLTADYFKSCLQLTALASQKKVELQFGTIGNESLVTRARNTLVQLFMDEEKYTHLLFIDADLSFDPQSVFRMLDLDEDVVTGVYPRKVIDWTRAIKKVKDNQNIKDPALKGHAPYQTMSGNFEKSIAFKAACELVFHGRNQPSGYTEPILHLNRLLKKN